MSAIVAESSNSRVFYLHEFIYFSEALDYDNPVTFDYLRAYLIHLLIIFDHVMIPMEHLTIARTESERAFKARFLGHPSVRHLIEGRKIITTIWRHCSDIPDHLEACTAYMHSIAANTNYFPDDCRNVLYTLPVFHRDTTYQSSKAAEYLYDDMSVRLDYAPDTFRYEADGMIITFSHEKLFLSQDDIGQHDQKLPHAAACGYIKAMPDGNGRIYRSSMPHFEAASHDGGVFYNPLGLVSGTNPLLFNMGCLTAILQKLDFRLPTSHHLHNPEWIRHFVEVTNDPALHVFRDRIFSLLEFLSQFPLKCDSDLTAYL